MLSLLEDQQGFTFQLASDLHLELFGASPPELAEILEPAADVLFLAGDIFHPFDEGSLPWLTSACALFKVVIFVNGNHEFYQKPRSEKHTVAQIRHRMQEIGQQISNLVVLDPGALVIGGVRVIGATLWSCVPVSSRNHVQQALNDYNICYTQLDPALVTLTVEETVRQHEVEVGFITDQLKEARRAAQRCLVVTHHCPMLNFTSEKVFEGCVRNPTLHAFGTDLMYLFQDYGCADNSTCDWWLFGHSHNNLSDNFYGTMVYSNQRGYQRGQQAPEHTGEAYSKNAVRQISR